MAWRFPLLQHNRHFRKLAAYRQTLTDAGVAPVQRRTLTQIMDALLQARAKGRFLDRAVVLRQLLDGGYALQQADILADLYSGSPEYWRSDTPPRKPVLARLTGTKRQGRMWTEVDNDG